MHLYSKGHYLFDDSLVQYGDGIFETMLAVESAIFHWHYHWQRLEKSCRRLGISVPDHDALYASLQSALGKANNDFSVVKMIVSRGAGLRGYRSLPEQPCTVQFSVTPYTFAASLYQGLKLRICQTRLAKQPLLAGMKHCNRLEYIMARREPEEAQFDEGLLLDYDGHVIEGLISNVFLINNRQITTPILKAAGVAGTLRAYLLDWLPNQGYTVSTRALTLTDMASADAVFLTNASGGVMPVKSIQGIEKSFDMVAAQNIRRLTEHPCSRV